MKWFSSKLSGLGRDGPRCDGEEGYTLSEMLVVLAILAMLMAVVTPQILGYLDRAKSRAAALQIQGLSTVLDLYYFDVGNYPTTEQGLQVLLEAPEGATIWIGPYVQQSGQLLDPWGQEFRYQGPGAHGPYDLYSYGGDNEEGGNGVDQDVTNW